MASKYMPVNVDVETYELAKACSEKTGGPVTRVAAEAVKEWLETVGAARLKAFGKEP